MEKWQAYLQEASMQVEFAKRSYTAFRSAAASDAMVDVFLHLHHFDERLDQQVKEYGGHAFLDMNIVNGANGFPKKAFLRALDGDTSKFHGEDYNIQALYASILKIEHRLTTDSDRTVFSAPAQKPAS